MKRLRCIDDSNTPLIKNAVYNGILSGPNYFALYADDGATYIGTYGNVRFQEVDVLKRVRCIDAYGSAPPLVEDNYYEVRDLPTFTAYYLIPAIGPNATYRKDRFVDALVQNVREAVELEAPTSEDKEEMNLRARWVASTITPGCCKSCNAPLPCKWHPQGG